MATATANTGANNNADANNNDGGAIALHALSSAAAREAVLPAAADIEGWLAEEAGARGAHAWWRAPFGAQCGASAAPSARAFVCRLGCAAREPELEHSLAATGAGTARYGAAALATLCNEQKVSFLVWISAGVVRYKPCRGSPRSQDKFDVKRRKFVVVSRMLHVLSCSVALPDVVFAFLMADFPVSFGNTKSSDKNAGGGDASPAFEPRPAVVQFVASPTFEALLWPTPSFVSGLAHRRFDVKGAGAGPSTWLEPGGAYDPPGGLSALVPWKNKETRFFWRGSLTGGPYRTRSGLFRFLPRPGLVRAATAIRTRDTRDGKLSTMDAAYAEWAMKGKFRNPAEKAAFLAPGEGQRLAGGYSRSDLQKYKFLLHADGNSASWGLAQKLATGSAVVWARSQRGFREFYYARLRAYEHFIPVGADWADLEPVRNWLAADEAGGHSDSTAAGEATFGERVGTAALDLVRARLRPQDMWCYAFRLVASLAARQEAGAATAEGLHAAGLDPASFLLVPDAAHARDRR